MKKRILALVLSVAMVLSFVPFSAFADEPADYAAGDGAYYLMDVPEAESLSGNHWTSLIEDGPLPIVEENGERFFHYNEPVSSEYNSYVHSTKITYGEDQGIPSTIPIGDNNAETPDDLKTTYVAIRMKVKDNTAAYTDVAAAFRLYLIRNTDSNIAFHAQNVALRWFDLNDGSMTWFHSQSGYNKNGTPTQIEFMGDMDGYLMVPFAVPTSETEATTIMDDAAIRDVFQGFHIYFMNKAKDSSNKASSWEDRELLLGDAFLVNDVDAFAAARSAKYGSYVIDEETGEKTFVAGADKYSPIVDDTASYAFRVGGYRSYAFLRAGKTTSKAYTDANVYGSSGNSDSFLHVTTLKNGDRAYEIILNSANNSTATYTTGSAMFSMCDTYDDSHVKPDGSIPKRAIIGEYRQGVPESIELADDDYLAVRVATEDGTVDNEAIAFKMSFYLCGPLTDGVYPTGTSRLFQVRAGDTTYVDINTGKTETITVNSALEFTYEGNLDGYILIPMSQITYNANNKLTASTARTRWGGVTGNYNKELVNVSLTSGWENSKALYIGDIFFVGDETVFTDYHTDCDKVGHAYEKTAETPATCTEAGSVTYTCQRTACTDKTLVKELPALGHDWVEAKGQDATCTNDGYVESYCERNCGVEVKIDEIPATGKHIASETATPAGDDANHNYICKYDGCTEVVATEECTYVEDETKRVEPQVGVAGTKVLVCSVCGNEKTEEIPALEPTCDHANYTIINATDAKCGEAGYSGDKQCDDCGEVFEFGGPTAALEHDQDTVLEGKDATCTEPGLTTGYACSKCGEVQVAQEEIPAPGHNQETIIEGKEATCTETGLTEGKACSKCGEIQVAQEEIAAKGHTEFGTDGWVNVKELCGNGCGTVLYDLEAELKTGYAALQYNVSLDGAIVIDYVTTLDLNGKMMALTGSDKSGDGIFWVKEGGELTINGDGELNSVGNSSEYKMVLWADGGKITINGGFYTNQFDTTNPQYDLIYVKNGGEITINGGEFSSATPRWTLNSNNDKPGKFIINGGRFYQYDPSNIDTDEGFTSWVDPSCYDVVKEGQHYTLVQHVCDYKAKETVAPEQFVAGYTIYECTCGTGYKADYVMPLCNEVQNVKAEQITETMDLKVTWDELDGADMYLVYVYNAEGEQIRGATITDGRTSVQIDGFKVGNYTVKVRARVGGKYTAKYDAVEVTFGSILPDAPKATIVATTKNSITVKWDAVEGAEAYFVEIVGGDQRFAPSTTGTEITWSGLKPNTEYKVSICVRLGATVYVGYGEQTDAKTKDYEEITIKAEKADDGIKVEWTVANADKYWVKRVDADGNVTQIAVTAESGIIAKDVEGANSFYIIARVTDEYGIYRYVTSETVVAQ